MKPSSPPRRSARALLTTSLALLCCNILLVPPSRALSPYTWTVEQTSRGAVPHYVVAALGPDDVWVGSSSARILHYSGASWTEYTLGEANCVTAIYPVSATDVYACTSCDDHNQYWNSNVYHFDGTGWTNMPRNHNTHDFGHIWISGGDKWLTSTANWTDGSIWKWNDNIGKWDATVVPQPAGAPYAGLCMVGSTVWLCNTRGNVYYGGEAGWTATTIPDPEDPPWSATAGIAAAANDDVWVIGPERGSANSIFYHFDGANWTKHTTVNDVLTDVHAVSPDNVWAIGREGVYNYNGSGWSKVYDNFWNPLFPKMWATAGNVWAIDRGQSHGNLLHGVAGKNPPPPPPEPTSRTWAHDSVGVSSPSTTWYLAEGCTGGDYETWVLVQNPNAVPAPVNIDFMTSTGLVRGPQDFPIPANSRRSFNVKDYVTDYDVSTKVTALGGAVICERAVYGGGRTWGHDSVGVNAPADNWFLAEGCTGSGFETWVLVQNPNDTEVKVDLTLMTSTGAMDGPQNYPIPGNSRHSFKINDYVTDYDVSTKVDSFGGKIVCERAMYSSDHVWGHDSVGITQPATEWYLAEGCTGPGFETWVLVQNPYPWEIEVDLDFMTSTGPLAGPQGFPVPANSRQSFRVNDYVEDYNVSTKVSSLDEMICERAVYNSDRTWGTDSVGAPKAKATWYLAEGCTGPGFETWVLVQNPNDTEVAVSLTLMTDTGQQKPEWLQYVTIPANSRTSFNLGQFVQSYNVSTKVESFGGSVVCERAMYGDPN